MASTFLGAAGAVVGGAPFVGGTVCAGDPLAYLRVVSKMYET